MPMLPIAPYSMPSESDIPDNTVCWQLRPDRAALLIHDMQRYFLAPFAPTASPAIDLVRSIADIRRCCIALGVPVAYTAQPGGMTEKQRGLLRDFWGPGMTIGAQDREVVEPLAPREHDRVFTKWRYSAFHQSDLLTYLREHGRDQLIVCGVYAHVGCLMTACDAFTNDIEAFLVADAVADFSLEYHRLALRYAAERCAATPTTARVLAQLTASACTVGASRTGDTGAA